MWYDIFEVAAGNGNVNRNRGKMSNNMENEIYQIDGVVENIVYRNDDNGYTVIDIDSGGELVCAVGTMPGIDVGDKIIVHGPVKQHPIYGEQIAVIKFEFELPDGEEAILKYLSSRTIKGVGARMAQKIVERFGDKTLEVMENEPERLAMINGISLEKARDISDQIKQTFGFRQMSIDLIRYGVRPEESVRIWNKLGIHALSMIEQNPYILCEEGIGIPFRRADEIADKLDNNIDRKLRMRAFLVYILKHNSSNGYTCAPRKHLVKICADNGHYDKSDVESVVDEMIDDSSLMSEIRSRDDLEFIFLPNYHKAETYSASRLQMLMRFPPNRIESIDERIEDIEKSDNIQYAERQKEAIRMALSQGALILTGGPGTGKTTTLNAIIRILSESGENVLLAAPTGRAAKRMSELTGCEAKTIHRLLEVEWNDEERPVFRRNEQNTLACDALVLDEVSMIDSLLFENVMRAFPLGCRLILVGDSDQLPSVGAGNVLEDLISSKVIPTVTLGEVFRQSMKSLIISNAHKINRGELPEINRKDSDFFFITQTDEAAVTKTVVDLCSKRLPKAYGYSLMEDIQVLSPSKITGLGTAALNAQLQQAVNPPSPGKAELHVNSQILRVGDKVMQTKNNYNIPWDKDDGTMGEGVFNGDIGMLTEVDEKNREVVVVFDDKTVRYTAEEVIQLELAYCTTIHKSQGSEFNAVIIPILNTPKKLMYRNLIYTAVTRAKKLLIIVGSPGELLAMVKNNERSLRYSMMDEFLIRN